MQYFADFKIGGQGIAAIFVPWKSASGDPRAQDTGSFEIVVRSSRCKHCVHPTTPYDHALSKTYKEQEKGNHVRFNIIYEIYNIIM